MMIAASAIAIAMLNMNGFRIASVNGQKVFVTPEGKPFRSIGVCCVDTGSPVQSFNALNPSYSALRYYEDPAEWAKETKTRLAKWGFNTIGAWSEHRLLESKNLYQTPILHLGSTGIPWTDPWDPRKVAEVKAYARSLIDKYKGIPNIIGYYSDNELGWWMGAIFEWAFKYPANSPGRKKFVCALRTFYKTWPNVLKDFYADRAASFDELESMGRLYLKPLSKGIAFARKWLSNVSDQYYQVAREAIKEADPNALFLGDRYISNFYPEVAKSASRYVDVVSTNLNADWNNGAIAPFYLDTLHAITQKPIIVTEFYAAAMQNRSGNKNDSSGFPTVRTQAERASTFKRQVNALLSQSYILGLHWFQYYDEPMHGRSDGENYNMGLVDIYNRPYEILTEEATRLFKKPWMPKASKTKPSAVIPYIRPQLAKHLDAWPHRNAALPIATNEECRGDVYVCWNEAGLYIAFYWHEDRFFDAFYRTDNKGLDDNAIALLKVNNLKLRIKADGIGSAAISKGDLLKYVAGNGNNGGTRNTIIVRLPANLFEASKLSEGSAFHIDASLSTRGHAYTMHWKTNRFLAKTRPVRRSSS